jgi:hypothetical protein
MTPKNLKTSSNLDKQARKPEVRYTVISCRVNADEAERIRQAIPKGTTIDKWVRDALLTMAG